MTSVSGVKQVSTAGEFAALRRELMASNRNPLVLASIAEWASEPDVDIEELAHELEGAAELYVMTARVSFWLTDAVGKARSVHSGWVRVYPANGEWLKLPRKAPLIRPMTDRRRTVRRVIEAALEAAFQDGRLATPRRSAPVGSACQATVKDVLSPTQVLVETTDRHRQAVLRSHNLAPGLAAERLVLKGQRLAGRYLEVGMMGEFLPDPISDDPGARAVDFVGEGIVTSVLCTSVHSESAQFQLHPDVGISIGAGSGEDLRTLVSEGSVVSVEVICVEGELVASFSADEPSPAMSMLPGGPPWIEMDRVVPLPEVLPIADEMLEVLVAAEAVAGDVEDAPERSHAAELEAEIDKMEEAAEAREATIRELQRELRTSRRFTVPVVYADTEEQFRLEVWLDYLTRVEEASRKSYPWPEAFRVGVNFLELVEQLVRAGGIAREKVVDVCADVLCGRAREMPSRAVKEWTTSRHGPQLRRGDGAVAFRVRLQTGSASARRLRYLLLPSGEIELDWVGVHDAGI